ncbi:hypothetical protein SEA_ALBEDO_15 [Microbacterium phage Albedo]|nr:hypothetical protein QDW33_gp15 [Microbacterium phage Doobus]QZE10235.1 hypothetical protein SEA_DOOBUS_15 [Microbacterium phage Doobus]WNM67918.1 hypothetical protein SEA_ALBEDO_15 [Microbacterium phage Albedo]
MTASVANSRAIGPFLAQVTVESNDLTVTEARAVARTEGARLLGTDDVRIENKGWSRGKEDGPSYGFYEVLTGC